MLRMAVNAFPVRGRFRLVKMVGPLLAPPAGQVFNVNGVNLILNHGYTHHRLIYYGLYEQNMVNFLKLQIRPGDTVLDPGANIGYMSARCLGLVGPTGHVHSFEPSPTANAMIRNHNKLEDHKNWSLWDAALTDHNGLEVFNDTPRVMQYGYAALGRAATPKDSIPHQVEVITVDSFCARHKIDHVRFLKLDIEGSELPALHGAAGMIARAAIDIIMVETTTEKGGHRTRAEAIDALLRNAGYRSFHVKANGSIKPIDVLKDVNYREDVIWMR